MKLPLVEYAVRVCVCVWYMKICCSQASFPILTRFFCFLQGYVTSQTGPSSTTIIKIVGDICKYILDCWQLILLQTLQFSQRHLAFAKASRAARLQKLAAKTEASSEFLFHVPEIFDLRQLLGRFIGTRQYVLCILLLCQIPFKIRVKFSQLQTHYYLNLAFFVKKRPKNSFSLNYSFRIGCLI